MGGPLNRYFMCHFYSWLCNEIILSFIDFFENGPFRHPGVATGTIISEIKMKEIQGHSDHR